MSVGITALGKVTFIGRNGAGTITVSGLSVGDFVLIYSSVGQVNTADFQNNITTANQLTQNSSADYSSTSFTAFVFRG